MRAGGVGTSLDGVEVRSVTAGSCLCSESPTLTGIRLPRLDIPLGARASRPHPYSWKQPPIHGHSLAKRTEPALTGISSIVPGFVRAGRPRSQVVFVRAGRPRSPGGPFFQPFSSLGRPSQQQGACDGKAGSLRVDVMVCLIRKFVVFVPLRPAQRNPQLDSTPRRSQELGLLVPTGRGQGRPTALPGRGPPGRSDAQRASPPSPKLPPLARPFAFPDRQDAGLF